MTSLWVSTHSRPKAAGVCISHSRSRQGSFNTQPPEGGWYKQAHGLKYYHQFQHTAARRRLAGSGGGGGGQDSVSTHSRPKAAGYAAATAAIPITSFNTQPPEGGWLTPPLLKARITEVSTHSRPKAAGFIIWTFIRLIIGFNTQPPEGGWPSTKGVGLPSIIVSTHSRPKAAGEFVVKYSELLEVSTHSRPKAAG